MYKLSEELKRTIQQVIRSSAHPRVPFDDVLNVLSQVESLEKIESEDDKDDNKAKKGK